MAEMCSRAPRCALAAARRSEGRLLRRLSAGRAVARGAHHAAPDATGDQSVMSLELKEYQGRVLRSLRMFFRECARDGRPGSAFQSVL